MATFKAKARAVELLGKGQIADLPTAITELWKNGYDAYAKNLNCKLYLDSYKDNQSPVFLLSDDGFGMSETDINDKWFVLGTDSKARGEKINPAFLLNTDCVFMIEYDHITPIKKLIYLIIINFLV